MSGLLVGEFTVVQIKKDKNGKVTGEIKIDYQEAHDLWYALRYFKTHYLALCEDHYYDPKNGDFDATLMKGINDSDKEKNARLIRQVEFLQYELCSIPIFRENFEKLGQTGAED